MVPGKSVENRFRARSLLQFVFIRLNTCRNGVQTAGLSACRSCTPRSDAGLSESAIPRHEESSENSAPRRKIARHQTDREFQHFESIPVELQPELPQVDYDEIQKKYEICDRLAGEYSHDAAGRMMKVRDKRDAGCRLDRLSELSFLLCIPGSSRIRRSCMPV